MQGRLPKVTFKVRQGDVAPEGPGCPIGGSWKDIGYYLQTGTRSFEYQDTAKSYIGFRCAIDFLGRDKKDFE